MDRSQPNTAMDPLHPSFAPQQMGDSHQQRVPLLQNQIQTSERPPPPNTPNVRMIALEEHEEIVRQMKDAHSTSVKRLEQEIERLKSLLKQTKEAKKAPSSLKRTPSELEEKRHQDGSHKRPRKEDEATKFDVKWLERYNELKKFREAHGHSNIPHNDPTFKELHKWCQTQRSGYRNLIKGQETTLTPERLKMLNRLQFQWVKCKTPALCWDERFEQLKEYKKKHGHSNPPQKLDYPKGLGNWVLEQRRRYRERNLPNTERKVKRVELTDKQIQKMDSIDFEWSLRNKSGGSAPGTVV